MFPSGKIAAENSKFSENAAVREHGREKRSVKQKVLEREHQGLRISGASVSAHSPVWSRPWWKGLAG
jgi:hypothetical protein